jgi:hypothetical protein
MHYVGVQVGNAAARWKPPIPSRGLVPLLPRPGISPQNLLMIPPSPSSTRTRNSSASDLDTPVIRIDVVGPEGNDPYLMQEFYPPPSPISPSPSGSYSNEALIDRLDGVGP